MQQNETLKHLIFRSEECASIAHSIIWLHGLGATYDDFYPIAPQLDLRPETQIIFPQAPSLPVSINNGYVMPAWYDIISFDFSERAQDTAGIARSSAQIQALAAAERAAGRQVHYVGFSQGGAMALHLASEDDCASVCALSAYALHEPRPKALPSLHQHGLYDDVVPPEVGESAYQAYQKADYQATWRTYPHAHSVSLEQIQDLAAWLKALGL